jgi:predicted nucleic acid-binding protein
LIAAFALRHRLVLEEVAVDLDATLDLAGRTGLTAYDASYLWLARRLNAELVTLDRQLERAAAAV